MLSVPVLPTIAQQEAVAPEPLLQTTALLTVAAAEVTLVGRIRHPEERHLPGELHDAQGADDVR